MLFLKKLLKSVKNNKNWKITKKYEKIRKIRNLKSAKNKKREIWPTEKGQIEAKHPVSNLMPVFGDVSGGAHFGVILGSIVLY